VALSILGEIVQLGAQAAGVRAEPPASSTSSAAGAGATAVDPVCRMDVAVSGATQVAEVGGTTYYFCCGGCRARFVKDPQRYLAPTP
jgi:YHS domain-containing protein